MSNIMNVTMTVLEVAQALGIGRAAAYQLAHSAGFPAMRVGTRIIIPRDAFLRWLDAQVDSPPR